MSSILDRTPFDAPAGQMAGIISEKDQSFWAGLDAIQQSHPHSMQHTLAHWPVYVRRIQFMRFLAHYELFKMSMDLPGSIVELGVSRGVSFFSFHKFLEIFFPTDTYRRVYGFDSFEGLTDFTEADGKTEHDELNEKKAGAWSAGGVADEIFALNDLFNHDCILARQRSVLIKGRIQDTLDPFLCETPGLRISLLHLDMDLYEPTLYALERLWDLVVSGGVIVLDEYGLPPWGGEAAAFDRFIAARNLKVQLRKFNWSLTPTAYCIKP